MTVYSGWGFDLSFKSAVNLSASQWQFVKAGSVVGEINLATGASGPAALGVLQNDPQAGDEATVRILGSTKVKAVVGTAITYGCWIMSGSGGIAEFAGGSAINGVALEALASGSAYIQVLLMPFQTVISAW